MPRVFFSYHLRDGAAVDALLEWLNTQVAPAARGEASVLDWKLHRKLDWPGSTDNEPDFVCVVDIAELRAWSEHASNSIVSTHGSLGDLVERIAMTVTADPSG
jgi:hypothetical protein